MPAPPVPKAVPADSPTADEAFFVNLDRIVDEQVTRDLAAAPEGDLSAISGVRIGRIESLAADGSPLVDFSGNPAAAPLPAKSTVRVTEHDVRREAVLMFEDGAPRRPVIVGLLEPPSAKIAVEADGRRVEITAEQELVLRCGKASITLTRAGKVILRGAYVLSRSSGVNRIKGGSVQIN